MRKMLLKTSVALAISAVALTSWANWSSCSTMVGTSWTGVLVNTANPSDQKTVNVSISKMSQEGNLMNIYSVGGSVTVNGTSDTVLSSSTCVERTDNTTYQNTVALTLYLSDGYELYTTSAPYGVTVGSSSFAVNLFQPTQNVTYNGTLSEQ